MKAIYTDNNALLEILAANGINIICDDDMTMILSDEDAERVCDIVNEFAPAAIYDYEIRDYVKESKYIITCATDAYTASRMSFRGKTILDYNGCTPVKWVVDDNFGEGLSLAEAQDILSDLADEYGSTDYENTDNLLQIDRLTYRIEEMDANEI